MKKGSECSLFDVLRSKTTEARGNAADFIARQRDFIRRRRIYPATLSRISLREALHAV